MTSNNALLAVVLFIALLVGLVLLSRWFIAHRTQLVELVVRGWRRLIATPGMQRLKVRHPRTWKFVAARFARGEYLGLHLTLGLAVSLIGLSIFAGLTEDVVHQDPITRFDLRLLDWLHAHAVPGGLSVARAFSAVGSAYAMIGLGLIVTCVLAIRRQGLFVEGWITAFLGGAVLNAALKSAIHRPRPAHSMILSSQSWSFPSGHAMESLIGYGMLAYLLIVMVPGTPLRRLGIVVATVLLVLAIGWSRLYLGVHYFSDVVGGFAAGVLWLSACISGLEVSRRWYAAQGES
jgi:undecaprenyl-diphosphatase